MAVAPKSKVKKSERRVATRRQPAQGTVCDLCTAGGDDVGMGLVWNISTSGVSMLFGKPLDAGAKFKAELRAPSDLYVLPIILSIAHVAKIRTGDFFIGAAFQRHLEPDEIQPFLG